MVKNINGLILIDAPYSALNNAGTDVSERTENITRVKVIRKGRKVYPYVSGQAFRYWWRSTLERNFNWTLSPLEREKKIAFTEANPINYPDDDLFGYMRAPSGKGSETLTRASVLKTSPLISAYSQSPTADFGVMARHEGDPVPYEYEFYSTVLKGIFSLDLDMAGVFNVQNRSGYQNLTDKIIKEYGNKLSEKEGDYYLPQQERIKRVQDVILALHLLGGGAKQAGNLTDVAPKFVILTTINSGNHIFTNIIQEHEDNFLIDFEALKTTLIEFKGQLISDTFIGHRVGFLDQYENDIKNIVEELAKENINVIYYRNIKQALEDFNNIIPNLIE